MPQGGVEKRGIADFRCKKHSSERHSKWIFSFFDGLRTSEDQDHLQQAAAFSNPL